MCSRKSMTEAAKPLLPYTSVLNLLQRLRAVSGVINNVARATLLLAETHNLSTQTISELEVIMKTLHEIVLNSSNVIDRFLNVTDVTNHPPSLVDAVSESYALKGADAFFFNEAPTEHSTATI